MRFIIVYYFLFIYCPMIDSFMRYFSCFKKSQPTTILRMQQNNLLNLQNVETQLQSIEYNDTVKYIPTVTCGKVIKVYDGDTITIASHIDPSCPIIYRFSVRLLGIDSPEIKGKTENEKLLAKKSRDALYNLIYGKFVTLENVNTEKYGRLLADVKYGDIHINKWMLENNYAVPYDGGTKLIPSEWE